MAELDVIVRALDAARERDDLHAWGVLLERALAMPDTQPQRADYLDELAFVYERLGRYDDAVGAMREAVAAGWDGKLDEHPSAAALIADLLGRAGRTDEADEAWAQAQREDPRDPWLHQSAGHAYAIAGRHETALAWQTTGLQLALAGSEDDDMLWLLTGQRAETLQALNRPPDELQLRAEDILDHQEQQQLAHAASHRPVPPQRAYVAAAWLPADQYTRALQIWPRFAADYEHGPYAAYCARLEQMLKALKTQGVPRLALTPITIDDYLAWCTTHDRDPEDSDSRAAYSTELLGRDIANPWPPERNQPCWCGSQRKYKKCCQPTA